MKPEPTLEPAPSGLRTTVVLLAVCAVLGLWIFAGESGLSTTGEQELKERRVLPYFTAADAVRLELAARDGAKVVVARDAAPADGADASTAKGRPWRVEAPVADLGDDGEVARILNTFEWLEHTDRLEGDHAEQYDFGGVAISVRIERVAPKDPIAFEVGPERLGKRPLRLTGKQDLVFLVREQLLKDLAADPWKFRRKQLLSLPRDGVQTLTLRAAAAQAGPGVADREVVLAKLEGYWRLGDATGEFATEGLIDELVTDAYALQATGVEVEAPTPEDLARLGLAPARATLKLAGKDGASESIELGLPVEGAPDQRYARVTGRAPVLKVDVKALAAELERPVEGWRSDTLLNVRGSAATLTGFAVSFADGRQWGVTRQEGKWIFDSPRVEAATQALEPLLTDVLGLTIVERWSGTAAPDLKALGLDPPAFKLAVVQEPLRREVHVGGPKEGAPGVHWVKRVGEDRVFAVKIDALPSRLEDAPLEALDRTIMAASHWDAKKIVVSDPDGRVLLEAAKTEDGVKEWKVTTPPTPDAQSDKVDRFMESFEAMVVERWVAHDSPEARAKHGLDRPMKVAITIETFQEGKKTDVQKVLLLGKREGNRIAALAEGGYAIGRADTGWLDRMARGFAKGTPLLETDRWNVKRLVVREGDAVVLELKRPAENWKRTDGGGDQILETTAVEDLLEEFEKLEVARAEPRSDARLAEVGLAPPRRTITITMKQGDKPEETRTLLVGKEAGEHERWATAEGAAVLGVLYDEPLRALDAWMKDNAPPSAFPPVDEPGSGEPQTPPAPPAPPQTPSPGAPDAPGAPGAPGVDEQGSTTPPPSGDGSVAATPATPATPTMVKCHLCDAEFLSGGPFTFTDPRPPHPVYETCSMGHLEELKELLNQPHVDPPDTVR